VPRPTTSVEFVAFSAGKPALIRMNGEWVP